MLALMVVRVCLPLFSRENRSKCAIVRPYSEYKNEKHKKCKNKESAGINKVKFPG
jgi:hypothetical protein